MERPKIVDRIIYDGNRSLAVTYKKTALKLLGSCRLHAGFNKLGTYAMKREMPDGTVIEAQTVGGVHTVKVTSPWAAPEKKDKAWANPVFVLVVGNEQIGYKVALVPTSAGAVPKLRKFPSMREIMRLIPPVRQRELFVHRYSTKTDLRSYDIGEPIHELYVAADDGKIHLVPDAHEIAGPRCMPATDGHCPYSPVSPSIMACHEEVSWTTPLLDTFVPNTLEHFVDLGYTTRSWCYKRENNSSHWAHKHEVTYAATAAYNRLGFGGDVVWRRDRDSADSHGGDCLMTYTWLMTERWRCTDEWGDRDSSPYEEYGMTARVCATIERLQTPIGPAAMLGEWQHTVDMIHGILNADPNYFTYGKSEEFTYPLNNEFFTQVYEEKDACREDPTVRLKLYAYTDHGFFFAWGVSYRGRFLCPLTKFTYENNAPGFVKYYMNDAISSGPTYNNVLAKNISFAAAHDQGEVQVYFKTFLEGDFIYNGYTDVFDRVQTRHISLGVSSHGNYDFCENMRLAFEAFRADDLTEGLLTPEDPEPVKGTVMAYLFDWSAAEEPTLAEDLEVFDRINALRASLSLPPFAWSHDLSVAARIQAEDMAKHHYLGHIGSDGTTPGQRIDGTGFCGLATESLVIGENCAMGQETPEEAVTAWINSPAHYAAMIHPKFTEIGIGVAADETGKMYWCTTFAGDAA